jgi:hypothetical protein
MFETETALCEAFIGSLSPCYRVYAETSGWDFLIVGRGGVQIGVQAKLVGGVPVLQQALPKRRRSAAMPGPHYRAVLIARWPGRTTAARLRRRHELYDLASRLRIIVFEPRPLHRDWLRLTYHGNEALIRGRPPGMSIHLDWRWYRWRPERPEWIPGFVPDLPAGVPNPRTVTPWSVAACRLQAAGRHDGAVHIGIVREVVGSVDGANFNPRSLLARFYISTPERVAGTRAFWWQPRKRRPFAEYPDTAKGLGLL